jgi:hypothetical protein
MVKKRTIAWQKPAATAAEPKQTVPNLVVMKKPARADDATAVPCGVIKKPSCADDVYKPAHPPEVAVVPKQCVMKKPAASPTATPKPTVPSWPSAWHNSGGGASSNPPVACKRPAIAPTAMPPTKKTAHSSRWAGFRDYGTGTPPKNEGGTDPMGEDEGEDEDEPHQEDEEEEKGGEDEEDATTGDGDATDVDKDGAVPPESNKHKGKNEKYLVAFATAGFAVEEALKDVTIDHADFNGLTLYTRITFEREHFLSQIKARGKRDGKTVDFVVNGFRDSKVEGNPLTSANKLLDKAVLV